MESDSSSEFASSNPGTPHSPNHSLPTITGNAIGLRVIEARLQVNVARIGKMNPVVKVVYDQQIWITPVSSRQGNKPKWNAYHVFERTDVESVDLEVLHKALMLGDSAVGRCTVHFNEISQGHQTEWWSLLQPSGVVIGSLLLTFEFPQDDSIRLTTHSSQSSIDMKEELSKQLAFLDTEREAVQFPPQEFRFEKNRPRSGLPESGFETIRRQLSEENQILRAKDIEVKKLFDRAKAEDLKHKKVKAEIAKFKETLRRREAALIEEETKIKTDQDQIREEREKLTMMRGQLNHDSAKLKQERAKLQLQRNALEAANKEVGETSLKINKEIAILKKQTGVVTRPRDNGDDAREQVQLQQVRETLADKQRILMAHLDQLKTEKEQINEERERLRKEREELEALGRPVNLEEQWGLLSEKIDREVLSPVSKLMRYPST